MLMMFHNIRTTEKRVAKYRHRGNSNSTPANSQSREVAAQALLYSLAYTIPWIWGLILTFINTGEGVFKSQSIDDAVTGMMTLAVSRFSSALINTDIHTHLRYILFDYHSTEYSQRHNLSSSRRKFYQGSGVQAHTAKHCHLCLSNLTCNA